LISFGPASDIVKKPIEDPKRPVVQKAPIKVEVMETPQLAKIVSVEPEKEEVNE